EPQWPAVSMSSVPDRGRSAGARVRLASLPVTENVTSPGVFGLVFTTTFVRPRAPRGVELLKVQLVSPLFAFQPVLVSLSSAPGGTVTSLVAPSAVLSRTRTPLVTGSSAGVIGAGTVISPLRVSFSSPTGAPSFFTASFAFDTVVMQGSSASQAPSRSVSRQMAVIAETPKS